MDYQIRKLFVHLQVHRHLSLMAYPLTTLATQTQLIHYPCSIQSLPQNRISNSTDISLFLLAFLFPEDLPWQRLTVQIWRNLLRLPLCSTSLCSDWIPLLQMCRHCRGVPLTTSHAGRETHVIYCAKINCRPWGDVSANAVDFGGTRNSLRRLASY